MDLLTNRQVLDLNVIMWIAGTAFSLGVFTIKVGLGLGYGRVKRRGVLLTFSLYLALFVLIAALPEVTRTLLAPLLGKSIYINLLTALGMVLSGVYTLRGVSKVSARDRYSKGALLLILPGPVCITAMAFSTWAALNAVKLPPPLVGLGLGVIFTALSLLFFGLTRGRSSAPPRINLGLSMIGIGLYFIASLFLSAKIEEAKGMYSSFLTEGNTISAGDTAGILALIFAAMLIGYFMNKQKGGQ